MSEVMTIAELRKAATTRALTPDEALQLYGPGNTDRVRYALRGTAVVARTFRANEPIGDEWKDSPAAFGLETHPNHVRAPDGSDLTETVMGHLDQGDVAPVDTTPKPLPPEEIAAARRVSRSPTRTAPQSDFGDRDNGAAGPQ